MAMEFKLLFYKHKSGFRGENTDQSEKWKLSNIKIRYVRKLVDQKLGQKLGKQPQEFS